LEFLSLAALEFDTTVGAFACTSATAVTALQLIAASTTKVRVGLVGDDRRAIEISFNGTSATDAPARVRILRQTTAIGGSPTTVTPVKHRNGEAGTVQTTAKKSAGGAEPTAGDVYFDEYLHQQGRHVIPKQFVLEQSDRLGFEITTSANVNVAITAPCEE
jgi:hypothetical protein